MKSLVIAIISLILVTLGIGVYLQPNDFVSCEADESSLSAKGCETADAIVTVSGGDTMARTNHAIVLYKSQLAPLLVFSGAAQDKTGPSNASAMRQMAISSGIPPSDILVEENSANTQQNAANTKKLLERHNVKKIILVTSGYHQRRASLEFHHILQGSIVILNSPTADQDWGWWWWLTPRGWWLAIGELVKIIVFYTSAGQ